MLTVAIPFVQRIPRPRCRSMAPAHSGLPAQWIPIPSRDSGGRAYSGCPMPAPFSSSAPPPQKKHRADADRSSCRPPELPAPAGPQTALDGFRLSRLISLPAVRAVFDRASAFCCAARVSHAGIGESGESALLPANVLSGSSACSRATRAVAPA